MKSSSAIIENENESDNNASFVSNNVFLSSVAASNLSSSHNEDVEVKSADQAKEGNTTIHANLDEENNNDRIEQMEYSLDDSFIKMIDNTYKEMSLVISPTDSENILTNIKTEIKKESEFSSRNGIVPPPLAESSPRKNCAEDVASPLNVNNNIFCIPFAFNSKKNIQQSEDLMKQCDELLNGFESQFVTKSQERKEQENKQSKGKFKKISPKSLSSKTRLVSVLKPASKFSNIQPKQTIENYFANFSPDETNIRKIHRIPITPPPPSKGSGSRSEFQSPTSPPTPRFVEAGNGRYRIMKPSFLVQAQSQKNEKERQRRLEFSSYRLTY